MNVSIVVGLLIGSLVLSAIAVLLDRMNFPQRPFRAKQIDADAGRLHRDRTGAHIVEVDQAEIDPSPDPERQP